MTDAEFVVVLERLNARVRKDYRAERDELVDIVLDVQQERQRIPEFYRARIRAVATARKFRGREATPEELADILAIDKERAKRYKQGSGAWGTQRVVLDPEEAAFVATATRPDEYADVINAALAEGYDPPLLPPEYWPRYMDCRRARAFGRYWTPTGYSARTMTADYGADVLPPIFFRLAGTGESDG